MQVWDDKLQCNQCFPDYVGITPIDCVEAVHIRPCIQLQKALKFGDETKGKVYAQFAKHIPIDVEGPNLEDVFFVTVSVSSG